MNETTLRIVSHENSKTTVEESLGRQINTTDVAVISYGDKNLIESIKQIDLSEIMARIISLRGKNDVKVITAEELSQEDNISESVQVNRPKLGKR